MTDNLWFDLKTKEELYRMEKKIGRNAKKDTFYTILILQVIAKKMSDSVFQHSKMFIHCTSIKIKKKLLKIADNLSRSHWSNVSHIVCKH